LCKSLRHVLFAYKVFLYHSQYKELNCKPKHGSELLNDKQTKTLQVNVVLLIIFLSIHFCTLQNYIDSIDIRT